MKMCFKLFGIMLRIGLFTFGGGYAMIALLENEFVTRRGWIDREEFLDMVAIAESTPGPIAINSATYIGYKMAGVRGSVFATVAVCIPSFVIIYVISLFFDAFLSLTLVANAFKGIQVCVVYLIFSAGVKMLKGLKKTPLSLVLLAVSGLAMVSASLLAVKLSTVVLILVSGTVGLLAALPGLLRGRGEGKA